ncbi:conserved hypothetical protein [uncultured Desulfobacterium sp.]|uniref:DUF1844 domain-containing protein n=1 Tax=uncultured Desulfobacterium sp. TaxID=201089 RepID=A0A445MV40_9BACT|nr:conserved hypothetical protein [uncultured Desulfobacterium sp.]
MSDEDKGFVVKDRRSFDEKGDLKEKAAEEPAEKKAAEEKSPPRTEKGETTPLPEANFTALIFSLSSTALFHLGDIPDPQTGEKHMDLPMAKQTIDTIAMLQQKTTGNLTEEEKKFTEIILADLRWRFIKASKQ